MINLKDLRTAMAELEEDDVIEMLEALMEDGGDGAEEALVACQEGMSDVGDLFESGEYFVGDLIFAGELMTKAVEIIKPAITQGDGSSCGKLILCTVKDDLHDIGKNIVRAMLEAGGMEVMDLGIDVAPETIVQTAKDNDIKVIALSGVLTLAVDSMKVVVDHFVEAGMRADTKIIIGGIPVSEDARVFTGADEWAHNAAKTVDICRNWLS